MALPVGELAFSDINLSVAKVRRERVLKPADPPGWVHAKNATGMLRPHRHEELEMNLVLSGRAAYLLGEKRIDLSERSLVWFFPDEEHILIDTTPDFTFWLGVWKPEFIRGLVKAGAAQELRARRRSSHHRKLGSPVFKRLKVLCEEVSRAPNGAVANAQGFLVQQSWKIFSEAPELPEVDEENVHPAVAQTVRALQEDPALGVAEISKKLELTPDHLSRLFHQQIGLPLIQYRTRQRLEKVRVQVEEHQADFTAAALAGGFGSYSAFHRAFESVYRQTPREWLKSVKASG